MIYITGDMHGDENRLLDRQWHKLKAGDTVIVCGDFGYLWNGSQREKDVIDYLSSRKYTVAFLDGTHENFDLINRSRVTYWKGGKVHRIKNNLFHLMRGQIFTIDNIKMFVMGGGESPDKDMHIDQGKWWKEEIPSPEEMSTAVENLSECNGKVDYILTHEPPTSVKSAMLMRNGMKARINKLNGFFDEIDRECRYKHWIFGSMHEDRTVTPKHTCVYTKLYTLSDIDQSIGD